MPTYQYKCNECENEFEEIHRIADREVPVDKLCGICGRGKIQLIPQIPSMISMRGSWRQHTSDGWKDRLKEIKRNNPGSQLDI
jgi:putative FmdB family regulatory protein